MRVRAEGETADIQKARDIYREERVSILAVADDRSSRFALYTARRRASAGYRIYIGFAVINF